MRGEGEGCIVEWACVLRGSGYANVSLVTVQSIITCTLQLRPPYFRIHLRSSPDPSMSEMVMQLLFDMKVVAVVII